MEAKHLQSIGFADTSTATFDPYCHITNCHRCGEQKPCVEGFRSAGDEEPVEFYECEDCSQEIKVEVGQAILRRAGGALLREREGKQ